MCNTKIEVARTQKTMNIEVWTVRINLTLRRDLVDLENSTCHPDVHTRMYCGFEARCLYTDFSAFLPIIILTST